MPLINKPNQHFDVVTYTGFAETVTVAGNAQISTAQSKFDGSSALFDGSGDSVSIANSTDLNFGSGDFTIEFWMYPTSVTGVADVVSKRVLSSEFGAFLIYRNGTALQLYATSNGTSWNVASAVAIGTVALNTWYHVAVSRQGTTFRTFLNGVAGGTASSSGSLISTSSSIVIGGVTNAFYAGYVDDLRMYKGLAKYTAAFTVPAVPTPVGSGDPNWSYCVLAMPMDGTNASTSFPLFSYSSETERALNFVPDLVWIKSRSAATDHALYDSMRDVTSDLVTSSSAGPTSQLAGLASFAGKGHLYESPTPTSGYTATLASSLSTNFTVDFYVSYNCGSVPGDLCDLNVQLLDASDNIVASYRILDASTGSYANTQTVTLGGISYSVDTQYYWIYHPSASGGVTYSTDYSSGFLTIERVGNTWNFYRSPYLNRKVLVKSLQYAGSDIAKVRASIPSNSSAYGDGKPGKVYYALVRDEAYNSTKDGFTVGSLAKVNTLNSTYAAWCWNAGTYTANSNGNYITAGTVTANVAVNRTAGFSIASYYTPASGAFTIGHDLGATPKFVIVKGTGASASNWVAYHASVSTDTSKFLTLNTTNALTTVAGVWGATLPTSSIIGMTAGTTSIASQYAVVYSWAEVAGFSSFGSYTGNGNANGPFLNLGFTPALLIIKCSSTTGNWVMIDYKRAGYNVDNNPVWGNLTTAEGTTDLVDILSNGFKVRSIDASINTNGATYVYAAWAEVPFKNSLAI